LQMKAYSNDLRERVAAACAAPGATQTAVAARFCVSVSFVEKLRQRSGPAPLLGAAARAELGACLRQQPDATLDELRAWVAALGGPAVSVATMGRAVQALDWRRKKRASTPPSATPPG